MYAPKHIAEYILLRSIATTVNVLPQSVALSLGSTFATLLFWLNRSKRTEAKRRIRQVFPEALSNADITQIAAASYRDLVWHTIEILRTPRVSPEWVEKHAIFQEQDRANLDAALRLEKGAIIAVAHLANWDLAGVCLQQLGYSMTFIVKSQKNPLFDRYLNRLREHLGSEVIERDDPLLVRKVVRSLRSGNVVAMMVDLRARQKDLELPFLGHTADLMRGVGVISYLAGCPVVPAYAFRLEQGRHQFEFKEAILPDSDSNRNEDAERILRESLVPLESAIRDHPEQYFWFNKKWVLDRIA